MQQLGIMVYQQLTNGRFYPTAFVGPGGDAQEGETCFHHWLVQPPVFATRLEPCPDKEACKMDVWPDFYDIARKEPLAGKRYLVADRHLHEDHGLYPDLSVKRSAFGARLFDQFATIEEAQACQEATGGYITLISENHAGETILVHL